MSLAAAILACGLAQQPLDLRERWIYCSTNLQHDPSVEQLLGVMRRGAAAGYTGMLLCDSKLEHLDSVIDRYYKNAERVKALAKELKLRIVPGLFGVGYSNSLLFNDPNLAEGLPVREALFVVAGGTARLEADPAVAFKAKWDWKDDIVGDDWTVTDPAGRNARIVQKVRVTPFRQYHVSVKVKTAGFQGTPQIAVLAGGGQLNFADLGVKPTQDWTEHHAVFNSLKNREVNVYLGCWDGGKGTLSWKDAKIEEVGLVNLLRRGGAPLTVKRDDDGKMLEEGKDFEPVSDPKMGTTPWQGEYDSWHEPPVVRTKLPDGTRLRVSYYHPVNIHAGQTMVCPSEPKTLELLRDQAKRVHALFQADGYFMQHDEVRVLNWDEACQNRKLTPGAIMADNVKTCAKILRETAPGAAIYVWSDVFDPHHNAHDHYYLVNGTLAGSWEGLDKDVVVACWFYEKRAESLKFFAERGNRTLIAGYYDAEPERVRGWLEAAKQAGGTVGVMYTTWRHKFDDLEKFAAAVKEFK